MRDHDLFLKVNSEKEPNLNSISKELVSSGKIPPLQKETVLLNQVTLVLLIN